jgi:hypothetical protein
VRFSASRPAPPDDHRRHPHGAWSSGANAAGCIHRHGEIALVDIPIKSDIHDNTASVRAPRDGVRAGTCLGQGEAMRFAAPHGVLGLLLLALAPAMTPVLAGLILAPALVALTSSTTAGVHLRRHVLLRVIAAAPPRRRRSPAARQEPPPCPSCGSPMPHATATAPPWPSARTA